MSQFSDFILANEGADLTKLLLSRREPVDGVDIKLVADTLAVRRKFRTKVPSWYAVPDLVLSPSLSGEQSSSEFTATFKAELCSKVWSRVRHDSPFTLADLTGGLGVDSWAFSKVASQVLYNEMNSELAYRAKTNFDLLSRPNIIVRSLTLAPGTVDDVLQDFSPDFIFLDPARRNDAGRKVFLLEDCLPDVLTLKELLLEKARFLMVKLSPMADIDMLTERLGKECREVYAIQADGDCRELLVLMERGWSGPCTYTAVSEKACLSFTKEQRKSSELILASSPADLAPGMILFEPGKALMKIGAFNDLSARFGMTKLGRSTHYYITEKPAPELSGSGKFFRIGTVLPLTKEGIREAAARFHRPGVTARNIPMDSRQLEEKLAKATKSSAPSSRSIAPVHIFGLRCDYSAQPSENHLIIASPI